LPLDSKGLTSAFIRVHLLKKQTNELVTGQRTLVLDLASYRKLNSSCNLAILHRSTRRQRSCSEHQCIHCWQLWFSSTAQRL